MGGGNPNLLISRAWYNCNRVVGFDSTMPTIMLNHLKMNTMTKISLRKVWVSTDGWRGYEQPISAVCGANDTGGWSDSPCPTSRALAELAKAKSVLRKAGIPFRSTICRSSNVFCAHRYICVPEERIAEAKALIAPLVAETRLLYMA